MIGDSPKCHPELNETWQLVALVELCPLGRSIEDAKSKDLDLNLYD